MPRINDLLTTQRQKLGYTGLPRGKICIRAVHHIFHPDGEKEECDDEGGWTHVRIVTVES
jgi:hypothetical protein